MTASSVSVSGGRGSAKLRRIAQIHPVAPNIESISECRRRTQSSYRQYNSMSACSPMDSGPTKRNSPVTTPTLGLDEVRHQMRERIRIERLADIGKEQNPAGQISQPGVQRRGLAPPGNPQQPDWNIRPARFC